MFGKRGHDGFGKTGSSPAQAPQQAPRSVAPPHTAGLQRITILDVGTAPPPAAPRQAVAPPPLRRNLLRPAAAHARRGLLRHQSQVFSALIDTIDLSQLAKWIRKAHARKFATSSTTLSPSRTLRCRLPSRRNCSRILQRCSGYGRWNLCWRAMTLPTSWSWCRPDLHRSGRQDHRIGNPVP